MKYSSKDLPGVVSYLALFLVGALAVLALVVGSGDGYEKGKYLRGVHVYEVTVASSKSMCANEKCVTEIYFGENLKERVFAQGMQNLYPGDRISIEVSCPPRAECKFRYLDVIQRKWLN